MGDRVAVLKDGILQQVDKPRAMYDSPINMFVAGFIGSPAMNLLTVPLKGEGKVSFGTFELPLPRGAKPAGAEVAVGMRPENFSLVGAGKGIPVIVELVEELGSDAFLHGSVQDDRGSHNLLVARVDPLSPPEKGETVYLAPKPEHLLWFDPASGNRIAG